MAPELIQEMGYDMKADIWSLGITAIEMAEGRPPHAEIHPMRAIFMIPTKPPPTLKVPEEWSPLFRDFIGKCLVKNPEERTAADRLLQHDFIRTARGPRVIREMIANAQDIAAQYLLLEAHYANAAHAIDYTAGTMVSTSAANGVVDGQRRRDGTAAPQPQGHGGHGTAAGLMNFDDGTLVHYGDRGGAAADETVDFSSSGGHQFRSPQNAAADNTLPPPPPIYHQGQRPAADNQQMEQLASGVQGMRLPDGGGGTSGGHGPESASSTWDGGNSSGSREGVVDSAFQRAMNGQGDYNFLRNLPTDELLRRKERLEKEMEAELHELQARFRAKRKAILDAIALKKNGTVQF